jgi:hypothetical protein
MTETSKLAQPLHHLTRSGGKFKPPTNETDLFSKGKEHPLSRFNR